MNGRFLVSKINWQERYRQARARLSRNVRRHWYKFFLLVLAGFLLHHKDLSIDLHLSGIDVPRLGAALSSSEAESPESTPSAARPLNTSLVSRPAEKGKPAPEKDEDKDNLANTYSNLSFAAENVSSSAEERKRAEKRRKQEAYIQHFSETAHNEMKKFGIPASITLAQGLLESNVGESRLARKNNNHFGIKCFSRSCRKGHCSNFTDDHHKDFFRIYPGAWESYRSHSMLLKNNKRYHFLFDLPRTDYRSWANGLQRAGYATDKQYAHKLIRLIEELNLQRFDR